MSDLLDLLVAARLRDTDTVVLGEPFE